jgi:hypothetical protein
MKMHRFRTLLILVLVCLLMCACDHEKTTSQDYGRFVMTKVMSYNSYLGLSSLVYEKVCRDDGELCIKCINELGCNLIVYKDTDSDYLFYTDRRSQYHIVDSVLGAEVKCENMDVVKNNLPNGFKVLWLDKDRLIFGALVGIATQKNRNYVAYEMQLAARQCVARQAWSFPRDGFSFDNETKSPDRRGLAWITCSKRDCWMRWFYDDYQIHEQKLQCAPNKNVVPYWFKDRPEPRSSPKIDSSFLCLGADGKLAYPRGEE